MKQKNKNNTFNNFVKVLEGNGFELKRRGLHSFVFQRGNVVINLPRAASEKDTKMLTRRYKLI